MATHVKASVQISRIDLVECRCGGNSVCLQAPHRLFHSGAGGRMEAHAEVEEHPVKSVFPCCPSQSDRNGLLQRFFLRLTET
jgi:hypothetical protein